MRRRPGAKADGGQGRPRLEDSACHSGQGREAIGGETSDRGELEKETNRRRVCSKKEEGGKKGISHPKYK